MPVFVRIMDEKRFNLMILKFNLKEGMMNLRIF